MEDFIPESLLEAHYHKPMVELFSQVFKAEIVQIFKPTPQKEVWVGFDKAFVSTKLSMEELYRELKQAIQSNTPDVIHFFFGLFLQFKPVRKITRKSRHFPRDYRIPYYRSELSLNPNRITGLSQHETLVKLNNIDYANVAYACPMIFDQKDLRNPTLDGLRIVDISTAPQGWLTNEAHFITFQDEAGTNTKWCSEPINGKTLSLQEWILHLKPKRMSGSEVISLIKKSEALLLPKFYEPQYKELKGIYEVDESGKKKPTSILPGCFTIFKFQEKLK